MDELMDQDHGEKREACHLFSINGVLPHESIATQHSNHAQVTVLLATPILPHCRLQIHES